MANEIKDTAVIHDLSKTMKEHIDSFYGNTSVYRTNKFFIGFFGEYVDLAINKMEKGSKGKLIHETYVYNDAFNKWKQFFYNSKEKQLDMRWTCADITIPHTTSKIETPIFLDSIKSIKYPIITGTNDTADLVITVRDDKNLMWYQFFNALNNCFYRAQALKPRSSLQKVAIYVAPIQEQFVNSRYKTEFNGNSSAKFKRTYDATLKKITAIENIDGTDRDQAIDFVVSQVFEFNSAVLKDISAMKLSNDSKNILEYTVTFSVPNTFQESFNNRYAGLPNNTKIGISENMFENGKIGTKYNDNEFTIPNNESALKSTGNGYYKD